MPEDSLDEERRRFVVVGANPLALRLITELVDRYAGEVIVVLPSLTTEMAPRIAEIPGITVIVAPRPTADAYARAGLDEAEALALVEQDDAGNVDAALLAREVSPHVRIVVRMFNTGLSMNIRSLLGNCATLSESAIAAPAFVAGALGVDAPSLVRLPGRDLFVADRDEVREADISCGFAVDVSGRRLELLPADEDLANAVLAVNDVPTPPPPPRHRPHPLRTLAAIVGRRLRTVLIGLLAIVLVVSLVHWAVHNHGDADRLGWWQALYEVVLTVLGGNSSFGRTDLAVDHVLLVTLAVISIALIPVLTAAVVDAAVNLRLRLAAGGVEEETEGHIVVVGLGNVGTRVIRSLHDLGFQVVAVDRDEQARGVPVARELRIPVVIGDATQEATLRQAFVQTCRALVVVSTNDVNNLESALLGRTIKADVRVVLRLFDGDFADRVQRAFGISISRSVSYLAAPAFAAAMLGQAIIDVIPVRRRVLLVAQVPIGRRSWLERKPVSVLFRPHEVRLLGIRTGRGEQTLWAAPRGRELARTDRVLVIATRAGLGWLLEAAAAQVEEDER